MATASTGQNNPSHAAPRPRQVHTITDRFSMSNTYLIEDQGLIVVDPGSQLNTRQTLEYITRYLKRRITEIDLIVLTHLHLDNTGGVKQLQQACGAPVAALASTRTRISEPTAEPNFTEQEQIIAGTLRYLDLFPPPLVQQARLISFWLEDVGGLPEHPDWRVIACPFHSPESLCLYNPFTRELICGTAITTLEGTTPRLRPDPRASRRQIQQMLHLLHNLEIYHLYPGHGRSTLSKHTGERIQAEW